MKHQIITKKGIPSLAIISYSDYLEYLELKRTKGLAAAESIKTIATPGRKPKVPEEVSRRLQRGEPPMRAWRLYRDLTQVELARRTGMSKSAISVIENGIRRGKQETLQALARVLDVHINDLTYKGKAKKKPGQRPALKIRLK